MKLRQFIPVLIIAAGIWAYHNSFQGPFIFDDVPNILENPTIRHLWPIWETLSPPRWSGLTGRPIVNLSLAVNYAVGGTRVWGYHALNLVIHILAGLTLFGIVRRTLLRPRLRERFGTAADGLALTTAVLWTVHPLQTESVTYIIQRCESMMGLFYLLMLYCFIRGVDSGRPSLWYGLCMAACALGMACKEVMVSAPLMVLLYDRTFVSGSFRVAWRRHGRLLAVLAGTWVLLGYLAASGGSLGNVSRNSMIRIGWREYLLTEPEVILDYLRLSVWPHPLCFDYYGLIATTWLSILPPALVMTILLAATVWAWKANSVWGFISAWFFLILVPTSSFFPLDSPMYEYRMYLPLAAVVAVVTVGGFEVGRNLLDRQPQTRRALEWGGTGALVLVLAILTIQRNQEYNSEMTIWQDTVEKSPNNPRAHLSLGYTLCQAGSGQEAIGHYEQALRIEPGYFEAHNNLGLALVQLGKLQEAISHYEQALRIKPDLAKVHSNLGAALFQLGKPREAIEHWEQALRIEPDYADAHYNLGAALEQAGRVQEAVHHYEQALRITPDWVQARYKLGHALAQLGRVREAMEQYEQALQLKPDFAEAHNNLGAALMQQGRLPEAIGHYEQALRIEPDLFRTENNLGNALLQIGKVQEAIGHDEQALRLKPDYAEAHNNLGNALEQAGQVQEAIGHYEQALRIKPDFAEAHYNLGVTLQGAGRVREAMAQYEQALRVKPEYAEAHNNLGAALMQQGRLPEAIGHYEQALRIKPDYAEAHNNLGIALEQAGQVQEAIGHYEQALRIKPGFTQAQNALARLQAGR